MKQLYRYVDLVIWMPLLLALTMGILYLVDMFLFWMQEFIRPLALWVQALNESAPGRWKELEGVLAALIAAWPASYFTCRLNVRARERFYRAAPDGDVSPKEGFGTFFAARGWVDALLLLLLPTVAFLLGSFVPGVQFLVWLSPLQMTCATFLDRWAAVVIGLLWQVPALLWGVLRAQNAWRVRVFLSLSGREDVA